SRPVSNRTLRIPNEPLSITASVLWTPSTGDLLTRSSPASTAGPPSGCSAGLRSKHPVHTVHTATGSHYRGPARRRRGVRVRYGRGALSAIQWTVGDGRGPMARGVAPAGGGTHSRRERRRRSLLTLSAQTESLDER